MKKVKVSQVELFMDGSWSGDSKLDLAGGRRGGDGGGGEERGRRRRDCLYVGLESQEFDCWASSCGHLQWSGWVSSFISTFSSCPTGCRKEGWASVSSVSELIPVGGLPEKPEGKEIVESPNVSSISQMIHVGGLPEQPEGKKPLEQLEVPEEKQQP